MYDDASGTLQYEMEGSGAVYPITNAYGFGAAGLAQRVQPTVSNRVTSFAYDPSGNTITRSLSSGTTTLPSGYPVEVALYDGYGYPKADVSCSVAYSTTTGPTSYTAGYSVGFGGQFGYYVENNTKLASADPRDRGLLLCTNRYYDPINARWLTRDPIGYDGDINLYGYVQGNPLMRSDPSGLDFLVITIITTTPELGIPEYGLTADSKKERTITKKFVVAWPDGVKIQDLLSQAEAMDRNQNWLSLFQK